MSPSKYLGLPWKKWGETDFWLTQGLDNLDERICHCGSGLFYEDCVNQALEQHMIVDEEIHYGQIVLEQYRKDHDEPTPGALISVRLPDEDEQRMSPEERAAREIAEMKARHGLT